MQNFEKDCKIFHFKDCKIFHLKDWTIILKMIAKSFKWKKSQSFLVRTNSSYIWKILQSFGAEEWNFSEYHTEIFECFSNVKLCMNSKHLAMFEFNIAKCLKIIQVAMFSLNNAAVYNRNIALSNRNKYCQNIKIDLVGIHLK